MTRTILPPAFVFACVLVAGTATANVIVVDVGNGPGTQFTTLQPAVNAAADGDILLIRTGPYEPPLLQNRSLTLQADGAVTITSYVGATALGITNLAAGKRIVLRGLELDGSMDFFTYALLPALVAVNNGGSIWLDSCTCGGEVQLTNCADVVVTNCNLGGSAGFWFPSGSGVVGNAPTTAITAKASSVFVHGSTLVGGAGAAADLSPSYAPILATSGAEALRVAGGTTLLTKCALTGGIGGDGDTDMTLGCLPGASGGPAMHLSIGQPLVRTIATTLAAGASGTSGTGCAPPAPGPTTVVDTGTIVLLAGDPGAFGGDSPVREGQNWATSVQHVVGANVLLFAAADRASAFLPQYAGALHVGAPTLVAPLGVIPASGTLALSIPIPNLPAGVLGVTVFTQCATCPPAAPCALSAPAAVVVLDSSL